MSTGTHPDIDANRDDIAVNESESTDSPNTGEVASMKHVSLTAVIKLVSEGVHAPSSDAEAAMQHQLLADRQATLLKMNIEH